LGDFEVLAKQATEVATHGANGEDTLSGMKMIERFFFDGIGMHTGDAPVILREKPSSFVQSHLASSSPSGLDVALVRAEQALHAAIGMHIKEESLFHEVSQS